MHRKNYRTYRTGSIKSVSYANKFGKKFRKRGRLTDMLNHFILTQNNFRDHLPYDF